MFRDYPPSRVAAVLLVIFAVSHTIGGLLFPPSNSMAADAVLASMKDTHFDFHGSDCTFYGFHMGFGLMVSIYLGLSAVIAFVIGDARVARIPVLKQGLRPVAWALLMAHVGTMVLSWTYFFVGPGIMSSIVVLLLAWECMTTFWIR